MPTIYSEGYSAIWEMWAKRRSEIDGQANALLDETPVISSGPSMYLALFRREILGA